MSTYDLEKMRELLRDFYCLTEIKICIFDSAGNELCYYPEKLTAFCSLLRHDRVMDDRCRDCDRRAFEICRRTKKQHVYTCHAGLLECVSPILYDSNIIGYIVLGQIKPHDSSDFEKALPTLPEEKRDKLTERYEKLPSIHIERINSAIRILDACTGYEYLKGLVRSAEKRIDVLIDGYIGDSIRNGKAGELSVQLLCSHFHLSHSEIYSIFREYFGSTPAEYIKARRLSYACELLSATELPISAVAAKCGVADYNYFSKIFKSAFGQCPTEYRKNSASYTPSNT